MHNVQHELRVLRSFGSVEAHWATGWTRDLRREHRCFPERGDATFANSRYGALQQAMRRLTSRGS